MSLLNLFWLTWQQTGNVVPPVLMTSPQAPSQTLKKRLYHLFLFLWDISIWNTNHRGSEGDTGEKGDKGLWEKKWSRREEWNAGEKEGERQIASLISKLSPHPLSVHSFWNDCVLFSLTDPKDVKDLKNPKDVSLLLNIWRTDKVSLFFLQKPVCIQKRKNLA